MLEGRWYRSVFPSTRIGPFKNSETEIELTARGFRLATSVGGTLTGRGGEIIVIDDPLKPDDALSETKRSAANQWFTNTLLSRLDDKRTGAIVVVMQRVHIDDLTGFLLSQSDEWDVLSLPAIVESDEATPLSAERTYCRRSGEALSPEREPLEVLDALKLQIGSDAFSAQYQQAPAPPGGAMVKRDWIARYKEVPPVSDHLMTLQSWDTASKGGPENDWSVTQLDQLAAEYPQLLFIATSNFAGAIDQAFLSRADLVVTVDLPTPDACKAILLDTLKRLATVYPKLAHLHTAPQIEKAATLAVGLDARRIRKAVLSALAHTKLIASNPETLSADAVLAAMQHAQAEQANLEKRR